MAAAMNPHPVDFHDTGGDGPPILFIPGSFSTSVAWRPMQAHLTPQRIIGTSLCGYGATPETRTLEDAGLAHQTRVIEAAAARIGAPVHLVGHSYGGTCALVAALGGRIDLLSVATFEANPLPLLRARGRSDLYDQTVAMSRAFERAHFEGEVDAAARIIDFWGNGPVFHGLPAPVQDYCRQTAFANVLDWRSVQDDGISPDAFRALDCPVLLVRGAHANPAMVEITATLAETLPNARAATVDGAGHFLISTHPKDCADLLADFHAVIA